MEHVKLCVMLEDFRPLRVSLEVLYFPTQRHHFIIGLSLVNAHHSFGLRFCNVVLLANAAVSAASTQSEKDMTL